MKTAKELFDEFATSTDGIIVQYKANFIEALSEHDNEIISEIEKKIEDNKKYFHIDEYTKREYCGLCLEDDCCHHEIKIEALTEIINLIKET